MSYSDAPEGRRTKPIIAVGLLHAVIAYGFISGLSYRVIPFVDHTIVARDIPEDTPPPPNVPPPSRQQPARRTTLTAPTPEIARPTFGQSEVIEVPLLGQPETAQPDPQPTPPAPPAHVSQARGASVIGNRAAWVTTDDYPPAALRQGEEGIVGIGVTIGADGRVAACEVTATSGSTLLDQATCRTYARRARFTPALDDEGRAVAVHRADRVRWQLPQ